VSSTGRVPIRCRRNYITRWRSGSKSARSGKRFVGEQVLDGRIPRPHLRAWMAKVENNSSHPRKAGFAFKLGAKVTGVDTSGKTLIAKVETGRGRSGANAGSRRGVGLYGRVLPTKASPEGRRRALDNRGPRAKRSAFASQPRGVYAIGDVGWRVRCRPQGEGRRRRHAEFSPAGGHGIYDVIPGVVYTTRKCRRSARPRKRWKRRCGHLRR